MTPIQKAACATVAGLVSLALPPRALHAQQNEPETQSPAPIVRVPPQVPVPARPRTATPGQTAPDSAVPARHARPATQPPTPESPKPAIPASPQKPAAPEHKPAAPTFSATGLNRNIIVLDPAHGGTDGGARIGDATLEKNVTLAFAFRLRSLLVARGFTVVLTRDSDANAPNTPSASGAAAPPGPALSLDDRAGIANHARATACLLIHATGRGMGVHLYNSELGAVSAETPLLPWLTAQAAWVPASRALEGQMSAALSRSRIQLVSSTASVRPVDSLTCPALVVELAPETDTPASINDAGYQSRVAAAIAGALVVWENAVQPPVKIPATPFVPHPKKRVEPATEATSAPEAQP